MNVRSYLQGLVAVVVFSVIALAYSPGVSAQSADSNQWVPFDFLVQCPEEDIYIEGMLRLDFRFLGSSGNQLAARLAIRFQGRGYSIQSGADYIVNENRFSADHLFPDIGAHYVFTWVDQGLLIGQADAPNYNYRFRAQFVVSPAGEISVDHFTADGDCFP